jgi:excisionase family DNA binding protein
MTIQLYTTEEVAEMLKLHVKTVRKLAKDKKLKGVKLSGDGDQTQWRFSAEAIREYAEGEK